ncbi:isoleucine--tRNA ligase [Micrococcus flavus]|uniref:Isoleucine--tRNA ligase n=1 Tax=Micrococcus flavus TaxID=384602 RepID=A0A4Y8X3N9_9MICC|nr:isoleucine--tRNA ligase [Micrococcus flavus]MBB4882852.1 isoleucyl-tRNA synthetase [Micrococcus flavus]TFI04293.1 isoleucine--tRNA ligase [Micrococcus flavus]GGK40574.1 isoleucine--tRNA ligase [Micrococcus flavus]
MYPLASSDPSQRTPASPRLPELEERVLRYWAEDGTFQASIDQRPAQNEDGSQNEFVFYDGPPFANGLPHYGHLLTGYVKDLVARYQTQQGRRVERRFGWDTHGLPAELEAMKQLGMTDKSEIEQMGIDTFNDACRASVLKYTDQWQDYVTRQARWVDFENDYKTLTPDFMESVIWAFSELHRKGLTYRGFRVLPYCWHDETPLSNHELRMDDDVYQMRQDPSVTVSFPIRGLPEDPALIPDGGADAELAAHLAGVHVLAWTTTPWTLPTNAALAVGPEIDYALVPAGPEGATVPGAERFLLAQDRVGAHAKELGYADADAARAAVTETVPGARLGGLAYAPLFTDLFEAHAGETFTVGARTLTLDGVHRILVDDYVSTDDGTGVVHQAPAYGEDDQRVCEAAGIPVLLSVDEGARFLPLFARDGLGRGDLRDIAGVQVFEANTTIVRALRALGRVAREASYEHSYPHCWRCRTPLIYRAITSWYVAVTKVKDRMLELNEEITWIPGNVKHGQFGTWVANARDWSISRNRYWGSPIPVWESDHPDFPRQEVYGSLAEIEEAFGRLPRNAEGEVDLHRPWIDDLTRPHPDPEAAAAGATLRRVEDVLDVWFDSGSMPYAQVHYPFERADWFPTHNPADFIVEYIGQTRGWFYTMHILATALFDRPAFSHVISHGIVLGSDGQKMSKSLRNYPDVTEVLDRDGSDAMRWFLMASPILRGGNLIVTEEGIREAARQVILPAWNAWHFFSLYANTAHDVGARPEGYRASARHASEDPLDQYVLAATGRMLREVKTALDAYEVSEATDALRAFMDTLTNWYIRRSRERFFAEDTVAMDVLWTVLEAFTRAAAPLMPLVAEEIWRGLTGGRSVHLTDYPDADQFPHGPEAEALVERMDLVRIVSSAGSALRKAAKRRVRLPLARLTIVRPDANKVRDELVEILKDELNIKVIDVRGPKADDIDEFGIGTEVVLNFREAGKDFGKNVPLIKKALADFPGPFGANIPLHLSNGEDVNLLEKHYTARNVASNVPNGHAVHVFDDGKGFLVLDTQVTAELAAEGTARDVVRAVQAVRKDAGLDVSDRVRTRIEGPGTVVAALEAHRDLVAEETLTLDLELVDSGAADPRTDPAEDAMKTVFVTVAKADA